MPVGLDGKARVDLVVVGSVAVSEKGKIKSRKLCRRRLRFTMSVGYIYLLVGPKTSLDVNYGLEFCLFLPGWIGFRDLSHRINVTSIWSTDSSGI